MKLGFLEQDHKYFSMDDSGKDWLSVTTLVGKLTPVFDAYKTACRVTKKSTSKWFKIPVPEILKAWDDEKNRSIKLGSPYHAKREQLLYNEAGIKVQRVLMEGDVKVAPPQILEEGCVYPEHFIYMSSIGLCGQSDMVYVKNGRLYIRDYKTSKEIRRKAFTDYTGDPEMMLYPINHLENCEFIHYAIQLSIYAYMILRHNPSLDMGGLVIEHIKFIEESQDKYGYPIYKKGPDGEFIVKEIEYIDLPYLRKEVVSIFEWLKSKF
jgi:hypothetical protein